MPAFLGIGPDNAVAWCNFYRKGGWRTILLTAAAYVLVIGALIFLSAGLDGADSRRGSGALGGWAGGLLGLQFLFVVVIAAGRVSATIRADVNGGMIESLRMMPLPAGHAVVGYVSAAAASMSGFFAGNFVLGLIVTAMAGLPTERWLAANAILLAFAAFVWVISAFLAFLVKGAGAVLVLVSMVGMFGQAGLLLVAPGLIVLAGPLIGGSIFNLRTAQTEVASPLLVSVAAQFLVGAIFFTGAARKYRRPDALALGGWLGLALLAATIGIGLLGIVWHEAFQPSFMGRAFREQRDGPLAFVGSTVLALLVALVPLANFARMHVAWVRRRRDDPAARRVAPPPAVAAAVVTLVLAAMLFVFPENPERGMSLSLARAACVVAALFGFSTSVLFTAAWFYRAVDNAKAILAIWLTLYCLVPFGVDFAWHRLSEPEKDPKLGLISTLSPLGLMIDSTSARRPRSLVPGAIFHLLIPLLPIGLYVRKVRSGAGSR